jgi:hypothetical protein
MKYLKVDGVGRPKEPKYIAEEIWNKLLEANSGF